jgi:hypothetical protein
VHLAFNLNRMIPVQVITTDANTLERAMLARLLEPDVTCIPDRSYLSFESIHQMLDKAAFFVFRMPSHWKYEGLLMCRLI